MPQSSSGRPSAQPREYIRAVEFGVFSPAEIKRLSVCSVSESSMYTCSLPATNSVVDFRMGSVRPFNPSWSHLASHDFVRTCCRADSRRTKGENESVSIILQLTQVDRRLKCGTCKRSVTSCPGHFGAISLNFPVIHPGFLDIVLKVLRCVCFFCSDLLLTEKDKQNLRKIKDRRQRLATASMSGKAKRACFGCGGCQPTYSRQGLNIRCDWSKVTFADPEEAQYCQRAFTATEVRLILQQMTDESCALLALNVKTSRPENFVLTMLVVPPPIVRPSITISEGSRARGQDDLTSKLCDIVKANVAVRQVLEKEAASIPKNGLSIAAQQIVGDLAFHVSTFMNNELRGQRQAMQRSGLPSKSITSRLKGKEGRIRGSLMGKRVNFSARSVVSPDSQMDIDQVGVPVRVAMKLTVPEKTTDWNVDRLRACIRRGPWQLHGAHALVRGSSTTLLEFADLEKEAKTLKIGDIVERFLMDDDIVLFNRQPSLHKGSMMSYRVRIMPHKTFRLNMAVTLPLNADCDGDELNVHVPQDEESQTEARLLMAVPCQIVSPQANKPCIGFVQDAVIGSWLLTRDGTFVKRPLAVTLWASIKHHRPALPVQAVYTGKEIYSLLFPSDLHYWNAKAGVTIRGGQLVAGALCKITLGATSGGIVHSMYLSHGPQRTAEFLSDAQRLVNRWLATRGFSIRLSDCEPDAATREKVEMTIRLAQQKFKRIQQAGAVSGLPEATCEAALSDIANRVLTNVGKVVHASLDDRTNALYQAVLCASKGNLINVAQLLGCIGQTSVEGRRIFVADEQRQFGIPGTLAKCGFVANSYFSGLNSVEFFFHTMAGREGLIDTAVKTANTGYLQRRLMKAMETLTISYDRTVRNARKNIIQFLYGADSYDATYIVRQTLTCLDTPREELRKEFATEREWEAFWVCLADVRQHRCRPQGEVDNLVYAPGSVNDVLHILTEALGTDDLGEHTQFTPAEHLELLNAFCDECCPTQWGRRFGYESILRWNLRFSRVQQIGRHVFLGALTEMRRRTLCSLVAPGEAVGALSAQSISEPLTQLTLNSVDWNTTMVIHWTGPVPPPAPHDSHVGAFIDALIAERPDERQIQADGVTVYLPLEPGTAMALSADEDGNMVWTELEAVTRHPPINKDGSNTLVRVTTETGREVTVTKGKSLLVERDNKLVAINGDEVQVGDRVPVVNQLPPADGCDALDLRGVFHESEVVFSDVVPEAKVAWEPDNPSGKRSWFAPSKERSIYARGDAMRRAVRLRPELLEPGQVASPKGAKGGALLPVQIPLDREFGFFIGAYLAEGCLTEHQVHVFNNDASFREAVSKWPGRYGINFHTTNEKDQKKNNGTSISITFHCSLLTKLLCRTCGKLSGGKRVPGFAFAAPNTFVEGLLDAYISGDGEVNLMHKIVQANSRSKQLRDGIATLLARFGISSNLRQRNMLDRIKWTTEDDGSRSQERYGEEKPFYELRVGSPGVSEMAQNINLFLKHKEERLQNIVEEIPTPSKRRCSRPILTLKDVRLEQITNLEEVPSSHDCVYDLTVASTRNMTASNGFVCKDTFHSCGVKAKNVTLGVPRIKELIDVTKNMKTPSMRLVLKPEYEDRAEDLSATLMYCVLGDVVKELSFVSEPKFFESTVSELDNELAERERQVMLEPDEFCEWVGRIVLDATALRRIHLSPTDVASKVVQAFPLHVSASCETDPQYILRLRPRCITPGSTSRPLGSHEEHAALRTKTEALVLKACRETVLGGLKNISGLKLAKETLHQLNSAGDFETKQVTVLETQGGSLSQVLGLDFFHAELCTSNDVHDIYSVLGIEAATSVLFDQIKQTLQFDGSYTNERHLLLLCSFCAANSTLLPISRHGINRMADSGALSRASFEEVTDQLLEAAAYGDIDYTTAFSPAIMVGQRACSVGTGICYTLPSHPEEEMEEDSEDEVVFTSVDADIQMLSYQQDIMRVEAPYSDANVGIGLPAALQHSFLTAPPNTIKPYAPSSPKSLLTGKKRPYQPSTPRADRRPRLE